ncbi:MAG: hypothetical protein M1831_001351 [Alyxoria varia]|nr:MAG: hypothetical protein M1831_001351 [Alyxoria varia]
MPRGLRRRMRSSNLRGEEGEGEEEGVGDNAQQQSGAAANPQRRPDSAELRQLDLTTFSVPTSQSHQFGRRMSEAEETSIHRSPVPSFIADSEPDDFKAEGPVDNPRPDPPAADYPAMNAMQDAFYTMPPWDTGDGTDRLIAIAGEVPRQFEGFHVTLFLCRLRKYATAVNEFQKLGTDFTMHPFVRAAAYAMLARLASNQADRKACLVEASRLFDMAMRVAAGAVSRKDTDREGEWNEVRRWIGVQTGITVNMVQASLARIAPASASGRQLRKRPVHRKQTAAIWETWSPGVVYLLDTGAADPHIQPTLEVSNLGVIHKRRYQTI